MSIKEKTMWPRRRKCKSTAIPIKDGYEVSEAIEVMTYGWSNNLSDSFKPTKVYILSVYGEYGAEDVKVTKDKSKVLDLIDTYRAEFKDELLEEKDKATCFLEDDTPRYKSGYELSTGWGGLQLHIIECE